jgi:hypothetical protein
VFGTDNAEQGLRKMKDAMWKVDPRGGEGFRDTTIAEHPVLFEERPNYGQLEAMLRERFRADWFTIEQATRFTLIDTPFRDNGHLKGPVLVAAERRGVLDVRRHAGQRAGSFTSGTRMRFSG